MTYIEFTNPLIEGVLEVDENSPAENGIIDWLIDNEIEYKVITKEEYDNYQGVAVQFDLIEKKEE